jgi:hypothetical protein
LIGAAFWQPYSRAGVAGLLDDDANALGADMAGKVELGDTVDALASAPA